MLVLFGDYFIPLFSRMCMMWCVEDGLYVEVEDFRELEQQQVLVEGKSLLHSKLSYYNMHFNYNIYLFISLH
jgi:hypothetical protein